VGRLIKRVVLAVLALLLVGAGGVGVFAYQESSAFDESMNKVYDVPPLAMTRSTDPAVIARGEHLAKSLAGCATHDCHGPDLAAGRVVDMGPIGRLAAPNITVMLPAYTDGELARLIRHGIKKDGRSVTLMPVMDFDWLPDSDVVALVSYLRTVPVVQRPNAPASKIKTLGKVLDRRNQLPIDVARRIDHQHIELGPPPSPTKEYGRFVVRLCTGCHGEHLSGGPIPGAPSSMAVPLDLTPDPSGLAGWTYADFERVIETGKRKNGKELDPLMPVEALRNMDDTEKHALFSYLQSLPPRPFGGR
jgi:cytochrome c553